MNSIARAFLSAAFTCLPLAVNADLTAVTGTDAAPLVYDSINHATWPANANLFASQYSASTVDTIIADAADLSSLKGYKLSSSDFSSSGQMTWYGAEAWVNYLNLSNYGGSNQWALPKTTNGIDSAGYPDGIGSDPSPSTSQLATLFYLGLGQVAGVSIVTTNNGAAGFNLFSNVQGAAGYAFYWGVTRNTFAGAPNYRWSFNPDGGSQYGVTESDAFFALPSSPGLVNSAPSVLPSITGTLGKNGWYVSRPTTLKWMVIGNPTPVNSGCGAVGVPDTTGITYTCSSTNENGSVSNSVTIKKDTVAPTVLVTRPADEAVYALNQIVAASYICKDATSGVASCSGTVADGASIPTSVEGSQTFSVSATDNAGNAVSKSVTYTVAPPAATPVFSLKTGTYTGPQLVSMNDTTAGATIYYTLDGTTPTSSSPQYNGAAITIGSTETLKADATAPNYARSPVRSAIYTIQ